MINSVLIVGGGSAGFMTAAYLLSKTNLQVTLIESKNVLIVGVGESTIPSINDFLEDVGFSEEKLMSSCSAIRKYTIQHNGWGDGNDSWWHHFCFDESEHSEQEQWLKDKAIPDKKWRHAYHLDATKLGHSLRDNICIPKGLIHIVDDVVEVQHDNSGITQILCEKNIYKADLYIDCTGFKSLLRKPLGQSLIQHNSLINNYAICGPGDFVEPQENYTQTYSMDYGWRWRVSIDNRTGNGYAFNKDMINIDKAMDEFVQKTPGLRKDKVFEVPITNQFNPEPWKLNVISLGLSCGFLEPLEATGLFLIHGPLKMLVRLINDDRRQEKYNRVWTKLYDHLADFLSLHYRTSKLNHTEYWRSIEKVDSIVLPKENQALFNQYSYRQLAKSRGLPYTSPR